MEHNHDHRLISLDDALAVWRCACGDVYMQEFLTPDEVANMFSVDMKTVARWREKGQVPRGKIIVTPGGEYRYDAAWMRSIIQMKGA